MSKLFANSMAFAYPFALIGTWIDPLAAFAFTFAFGQIEAPQCVYMLLSILIAFANCIPCIWNLMLHSYGPGEYMVNLHLTASEHHHVKNWQFTANNIIIYTSHHERWFHYRHVFFGQFIIEPCLCNFCPFPTIFCLFPSSQVLNMDLHR